MTERVCAVVVTYNRVDLLRIGLQGLLQQSRPLDQIAVVNNGSKDGTTEMLAKEFPQVHVLDLGENTGGSGGFNAGMKWAYEAGFDWLWVMDDDLQPFATTLEVMLRYREVSDFIHVRRESSSGVFTWEGVWDMAAAVRRTLPQDLSFKNGKPWMAVTSGNFEGALIHRRIVDKVGYPDTRFFMCGDDSIYGFLASLHTNVIYVNHIGFKRLQQPTRTLDKKKLYFCYRNRFLVFDYLRKAGMPVSKISFWIHTVLLAANLLREEREARTFGGLRFLIRGIHDGWVGRYGRPVWL